MEEMLWGIALALGAVVMALLGVRQRKHAQASYQEDVKRYTASTTMKVVHLEESVLETWEEQEDGSQELRRETVYSPTYEYTVDGKTYQYISRSCLSSRRDLGRLVMGYYDPTDPSRITEYKPRRPIFGGFFFFFGAALLLLIAILIFTGYMVMV